MTKQQPTKKRITKAEGTGSPGYRKGTARAGGRPRKTPDQKRGRDVSVMLTATEYAQATEDARQAGLRVGPYLRALWQAGRSAPGAPTVQAQGAAAQTFLARRGDLRELLKILAPLGNNLNQAQRTANSLAKGGASHDTLTQAVLELAAMRDAFREAMAAVVAWPAVQAEAGGGDDRAAWSRRMEQD